MNSNIYCRLSLKYSIKEMTNIDTHTKGRILWAWFMFLGNKVNL